MLPARPTEKEPVTRHPVVEDPRNERGRRREPERKVPECWELGHRRMGERPGSLEAAPRHRLYPQAQENQHPPDWVLSPNAAGYHWASWGGGRPTAADRPMQTWALLTANTHTGLQVTRPALAAEAGWPPLRLVTDRPLAFQVC